MTFMAIRKFVRGSGMTETTFHAVTIHPGAETSEETAAFIDILKDFGGGFEANSGRALEEISRAILGECGIVSRRFSLPDGRGAMNSWFKVAEHFDHEWDSLVGFAARVMDLLDDVRAAIDAGNADLAARRALTLGGVATEAATKFHFEQDWKIGHGNAERLRATAAQANTQRQAERAQEWDRWNVEAAVVWASNPSFSDSAVARILKARLNLPDSIQTIRKRIIRPDTKVGKAG
tara:strand:- start:36 stop:740 length:705 start_codon:yes stop_codon:yes gene_type:complete